jgi:hypothetical protein
MLTLAVSVAVMDCVPAVFNVALNERRHRRQSRYIRLAVRLC